MGLNFTLFINDGGPPVLIRKGTNFVLDKSNSWINFDEFNSKHNFSANSDGEL